MTRQQLAVLAPYFREGERFLNGSVVEWATISFATMAQIRILRELMDSPVRLIRGAHPNRPEAVDACCPGRSMQEVFMQLTRLQEISWGIYSGNSFHIDTRVFRDVPARWMAIKDSEAGILRDRGLESVRAVTRGAQDQGWIYLAWNHPRAFAALELVFELADGRRIGSETV